MAERGHVGEFTAGGATPRGQRTTGIHLAPISDGSSPESVDLARASSIEELIERAVVRALDQILAPHLARLRRPEPAVYTVLQAATVLQVSPDTIARLVKRGVLARVPHLGGKVLIPRASVEQLASGDDQENESWSECRARPSRRSAVDP